MRLCQWYDVQNEFCLCNLADGRCFDCAYEGDRNICHKLDKGEDNNA